MSSTDMQLHMALLLTPSMFASTAALLQHRNAHKQHHNHKPQPTFAGNWLSGSQRPASRLAVTHCGDTSQAPLATASISFRVRRSSPITRWVICGARTGQEFERVAGSLRLACCCGPVSGG